jgi:DNA-binding transcriptional LysR family regulator
MEMRQLRYFLAVAERLHFTRAAELLHVAQPAVSQQIALLEAEVGARLFERTKRRVQLTPAGHAFRRKALMSLELAAEAAMDARKIELGEGGNITVGFVSTAAISALPTLLGLLCRRIPAATFELHEMDPVAQLEAMEHHGIDLGLTNVSVDHPGFEAKLLVREPMMCALPNDHPLADRPTVDLKSLEGERLLLPPRHALGNLHDKIVTACHAAGFIPTLVQPIRRAEIAVCLVGGRVGVAVVPNTLRSVTVKGVVYRPLKQKVPVDLFAFRRRKPTTPLLDRVWREIVRGAARPFTGRRRAASAGVQMA